ncbi:polysaccharide deacetylase family protein [Aliikangiella sp. IMCC44653]
MRKLHLAAEVFTKLGLHRVLNSYSARFSQTVPVLTYHRIGRPSSNYPFDHGLYSATPEEFRQQMSYLSKRYTPLNMAQMADYIEGKLKLPKKPVLVTFDDGFDDNYRLAFPILKELSIPATFFVTTDFIDSTETLWYERLAYFFHKLAHPLVEIHELSLSLTLKGQRARYKAYLKTVEQLKQVKNELRLKILSDLFERYGDPYLQASEAEADLSRSMSWEQLKEMVAAGMDIGGHSISHPVLSMLEEKEIENEIVGCKRLIESRLDYQVDSIAYPVGQHESYSDDVIKYTKAAGYRVGFSFVDGVGRPSRFSIERLHVDIYAPFALFKAKIAFPRLFCE